MFVGEDINYEQRWNLPSCRFYLYDESFESSLGIDLTSGDEFVSIKKIADMLNKM